jgi:hypothetical protein
LLRAWIAGKRQLHRSPCEQQQHGEDGERQEAHAIARGRCFERRLRQTLV